MECPANSAIAVYRWLMKQLCHQTAKKLSAKVTFGCLYISAPTEARTSWGSSAFLIHLSILFPLVQLRCKCLCPASKTEYVLQVKCHHLVVIEHFPHYLRRVSFLVSFRVPVELPFVHRAESDWRFRTTADNSITSQQSLSRCSAASALMHTVLLFINICSTYNIHWSDRQFRKSVFLLTEKPKFYLKLMSLNVLLTH